MHDLYLGKVDWTAYHPKQPSDCPKCKNKMIITSSTIHSTQECGKCGSSILFLPGIIEKLQPAAAPEPAPAKIHKCQWCGSTKFKDRICKNGHKLPGTPRRA